MAEDIAQQLEKCKEKYQTLLGELEQQDAYTELLQKSLGRLALAAQGLDRQLDTQLSALRTLLRKDHNQDNIKQILEKMERAIARMDSNTNKTTSAGHILAQLLTDIALPQPAHAKAKKLAKTLRAQSDDTLNKHMPDVIHLLESCIHNEHATGKPGLIARIFGLHTPHAQSAETNAPIQSEEEASDYAPHMILMQLLERLSLPADLSQQATRIRHHIEQGIDETELPQVINDIADIVSALGSQVVTEKKDYEAFLKSLTSRLNELDQHIRKTGDDETKAFEERQIMGQAVEDEVSGLRNHVEEAHNLEQLKQSVSARLDSLNQHFENYRHSDHQRYLTSQQQIQLLNTRLKAMEEESQQLREAAEQSREQALKDALTGIWNRQALNEMLEKEYTRWLRYQKPLSLIIWDIDFFKRVNDEYGHAAGDKVLKTIARIFMQTTRDADFIARYGGEEFVGLFPETRLEDALVLANKIRKKVEHSRFHYENKPVPITASAGLAMFRPNDTIEDVFKRADKALYQAKSEGRNRCIALD